ncbi:MAG: potassium channel family protein [Actinomycetota bacterium]
MDWVARAAGAAIVLFVIRDMFHTLGHPEGQGGLTRFVLVTLWRLSRLGGGKGRLSRLTGPLALFTVIIVWALAAIVGWALIYLPSIPTGFVYSSGSLVGRTSAPLDALYISMTALSTLGFGDIAPAPGWLRIVTPLEALFGFALLTVAVSWVLQVYPALARRRALAIRLSLLRRAEILTGLPDSGSDLLPPVLERLSIEIVQSRIDLTQYSETYYFRDEDPHSSLAAALPYAAKLARIAATSSRPDMRLAAGLLTGALEDFAGVLKDRFPASAPLMPDLLAAYAADHGYRPSEGENDQ